VAASASALHRHFVFDTDWDNVARRHGLEVHLVVGPHHAEGLLDAQVKGAAHTPRDMPAEGTQATRQQAPACASPSSTAWQVSTVAARSSPNSCSEEL
jgi:hypothetical protein